MEGIEHFELSISELMEEHDDGHELRQRRVGLTFSGVGALLNHLLMQDRLKLFAKVIDFAEKFGNMLHGRPFFVWCFVLRTKTLQQEEAFFFGLFVSRTHVT